MRFITVSEGLTDFPVLKNLLIGFFDNKNLSVSRILPEGNESVGWGNLLNYLSTEKFRGIFELKENFAIIHIDTDKCEEWKQGLHNIGDNKLAVADFIEDVKRRLVIIIGEDFYETVKDRMLFAITVHEVECWLLPFNAALPAHQSKMVNCLETLERIANSRGFSLNQKNYREGRNYEELSKPLKSNKELMHKYLLNPSLKIFVDNLLARFPKEQED